MRRTTTAWIAGTLGAGLTASIVLAQQSPPPGSSRAGATGSSATGSNETPSIFGASGARGARYLMRNGLDYLNYQQFERALKFLRDAEARQKELTDPERLMLKQGIERAQDGLRAAADVGSPYALSEQSRPRSGFTAARPEIAVAQRDTPAAVPARTYRRPSRPSLPPSNDDLPGEPIRLASTDATVQERPTKPTLAGPAGNPSPPIDVQAAAVAEIPALSAPEIPTLTAVPQPSGPAPRPMPSDPAIAEVAAATSDPTVTSAPIESPAPISTPAPEPIARPAPARAPESSARTATAQAPEPILLETPDSAASRATAPSVAAPVATPPAGGLVPTAMHDPAPSGTVNPPVDSPTPAACGRTGPRSRGDRSHPVAPARKRRPAGGDTGHPPTQGVGCNRDFGEPGRAIRHGARVRTGPGAGRRQERRRVATLAGQPG